jgi:large subunit ribosomal protein L35
MAKLKHKTNKSLAKRIKITGSGKVKYRHTNRAHHAHYRSTKQKRHAKKAGILKPAFSKTLKAMIHGKQGGKK